MDSLDEAMKKLQTDKKDGFTLTESLTVVVLVGILSAVAIASYNQQWAQERLLRASRETHTWLENQRLTAIKEGQACAISINTVTATLDPSSETISLADGVLNNSCKGQAPLSIRDAVTNGSGISLSASDPNTTGILFSFRGLSKIITTSTNTNNQEVLVLKLNHPESNKQRCIKLMSPLGLIRTGWSEANANSCRYSSSF